MNRSRYNYYSEIEDILTKVTNAERSRQDEIDRATARGYMLSDAKKQAFRDAKRQDAATARARLAKLKADFAEDIEQDSLPYAVTDITMPDGSPRKAVVGLSQRDRDFLESLAYVPLSKAHYLYYLKTFRDDDNLLACRALIHAAEKDGYKVDGVLTDPQQEIQDFNKVCKFAETLLDPSGFDDFTVETRRQFVKSAIENSYPYDENLKLKRPEITITEIDGEDAFSAGFQGMSAPTRETLSTADQGAQDPIQKELDAVKFMSDDPDKAEAEIIRTHAQAQIDHTKFMAQTSAPTPAPSEGGNDAGR